MQAIDIKEKLAERKYFYEIEESRLFGEVKLDGAKNSALRLLAASLLTEDNLTLDNFPCKISDALIHIEMLEKLGKTCHVENKTIKIQEESKLNEKLEWEGRSIRNTLLILGAMLARKGFGGVPLPGGCNLGERKWDLHELVFTTMGANVWVEDNYLYAESKGKLIGDDIHLPIRSTGATENAIICGVLATGITRVYNPHIRPEILDLVSMLKKMGAKIEVFGQEKITIEGVDNLHGTRHYVIPDNMEAITWIVAAMITKGEVEIQNFPYEHLEVPLIFLKESGAKLYKSTDGLIVKGGNCYPIEISTGPYPGINSDMQPLFALYGSRSCGGISKVVDLRFPDRYGYAHELGKMGLDFSIHNNILRIKGGQLYGADVYALDLRAGVTLALAGLIAKGVTRVENAWQIERGYSDFISKLQNLGGEAKAVDLTI